MDVENIEDIFSFNFIEVGKKNITRIGEIANNDEMEKTVIFEKKSTKVIQDYKKITFPDMIKF